MSRRAIAFRLTEEATSILRRLSDRLGISQASVVEEALRTLERVLDQGEEAERHERGRLDRERDVGE